MTKRAAIYVRQSLEDAEGIDRQEKRCRALAEARGWQVVAVHRDNAVSASKSRDSAAWGDLLAGAKAQAFDVIVAAKVDRIARRVQDVLDLVEIGVGIATVEGDLDTTTDMGRFQAVLLTALAELEVSRKGQRHRDAHADRASRGIPRTTKRPYGWKSDGIHLEPGEADHLRTALQNIVAGSSIRGECRRMNEAGARTPLYKSGSGGREWTPKTLISVLDRPRMAGLNTYQGVITERSVIEPVVTREEWEEYRAIRGDRDRSKPGRTPLIHWASGVAVCPCGNLLGASTAQGRGRRYPYYRCRTAGPGHVGIAAEKLEGRIMLALYREMLVRRDLEPNDLSQLRRGKAEAMDAVRQAISTLNTVRSDTARAMATKELSHAEDALESAENALSAALADQTGANLAEAVRHAFATEVQFAKAVHPSRAAEDSDIPDIDEARMAWADLFMSLTVAQRRELARGLLNVRVLPQTEKERIVITPR